jgi:Tfp pilus assembly protein PilF
MSKAPTKPPGNESTPNQTLSIDAAFEKAQALHHAGKAQQAATLYQQIIQVQPDHSDTLTMYGFLMFQCGRYEDSLRLFEQALKVNPESARDWLNCGIVLNSMKRYEDALASHERALQLNHDFPEAYLNRGVVLQEMNRLEEALASYDHAIKLRPEYADAHFNRGNVLRALKRFDEALESWGRTQAIMPNHAQAHFAEALCRLLLGDYARGWEKYEWRSRANSKIVPRQFSQPLWLGKEDIAGKTILLHAEQGFGDDIHFCRYAQHIASLGATVLLEVQPPLVTLLKTLDGPSDVLAKGDPLPDFDFYTPLPSLPLACLPTLGITIPAQTPYLTAQPERMEIWRRECGDDKRLRVGLAWSGSPTHFNDRNRSMRLAQLSPLLENRQVTFVSVQKEVRDHDQALLEEMPQFIHFGERLQDFTDTAALIATLDLVITVDTSVAHLAGALGKPVWIMLPHIPDWRWLLDRSDSPWYPTAKLYRQPRAGDWHSVIKRITEDLRKLCQDEQTIE